MKDSEKSKTKTSSGDTIGDVSIWTGTLEELFLAIQPDEQSRSEAKEYLKCVTAQHTN